MHPRHFVLTALPFVLLPGIAAGAAGPPDPAFQIRHEDRQRQREEATAPLAPSAPPADAPALAAHPQNIAEPAPLFQAPTLIVRPNSLLEARQIDALLDPYRPLALGRNRIELLLRQLNAQLVVHGLVTSRARIADLDRRNNRLEIELLPGRIEGFVAAGQALGPDVRGAFPSNDNNLLVLQDLEQGVHQIQRLRLYQAELRVLPGQTPNASLIDLHLTETKPWWLQLGLDNQGSRSTGLTRSRAAITLENALGLLDSLGLNYVRSQRSEAAVASVAIPQGYNTWSVSYAASRYTQPLPADLRQTGGSHSATLAWNRVLHLSAAGRDTAELTLTYGDAWRRLDDIALGAERLTVLKATAVSLRQGNGWRAWGEIDISRGLPWFGAIGDGAVNATADPHARFTKVEAHAGVVASLPGAAIHYTGQVDLQHSAVGLYGPEQFRLGGMSSVRGYNEATAAGDRGYLLRHEWQTPHWQPEILGGRGAPFLFLDHGASRLIAGPTTRLAGAGAGWRLAAKHWNADLAIAKPIDCSSAIAAHGWHLHATFRIDL